MRPIAPRFFVEPNATLDYAQELMKRNGIGSVAVVGKTGELVGFLQSRKIQTQKTQIKTIYRLHRTVLQNLWMICVICSR